MLENFKQSHILSEKSKKAEKFVENLKIFPYKEWKGNYLNIIEH